MKSIIIVLLSVLCALAIAFSAHVLTLRHVQIFVSDDTAVLTVFGHSHEYDYDFIDLSPIKEDK